MTQAATARGMGRVLRPALMLAMMLIVVSACASPPIETELVTASQRPDRVAEAPEEVQGEVLWGGVIVDARNGESSTELEVLAYPLDRRQRPITARPPQGRFLLVSDGYLETVDYAPGRLVTVLGTLDGRVDGTIGEATRVFARVRAESLHLWRPADSDSRARFTFGLGVQL